MTTAAEKRNLEEELRGLKSLLHVAQTVVSSLDLDKVLRNILDSAMGILEVPAGSIALYDKSQSRMQLRTHSGLSTEFTFKSRWLVKEGGLTHRILAQNRLFVINDIRRIDLHRNPMILKEKIRSLVAVPLKIHQASVGILYLDDFVPRTWKEDRLNLLEVLASFAAMSIHNASLHQTVRQMADTDGLTGLYNYRHFKKTVEDEMVRSRRYGKAMALVMFDVDNFKKFNDLYGHPRGDRALGFLADILRRSFRSCDILFRYGGEEFIAILPETELPEALQAAERARMSIQSGTRDRLLPLGSEGLTVSIGVAAFPRDGQNPEELLNIVDKLLYKAKKDGKNRVHYMSS